jgi:hypothetical protein
VTELWDPARHEALAAADWSEAGARAAIASIVSDVDAAFDPETLWPLHPEDEDEDTPPGSVLRGMYLGAAGMVHGLRRLGGSSLDLPAIARGLEGIADDEEGPHSLFLGTAGILLVAGGSADLVASAIASNQEHPANELILGAPGTMLAARAMFDRTGEERFADLWRASARTLLERQEPDGLWTQILWDDPMRCTGAAHGFAGNVRALLGEREWLDEARAVAITRALAIQHDGLANWPPLPTGSRRGDAPRVQWCHGAPGVITSLATIAPDDADHTALLVAGGELTWHAGPIGGNAGLCHGTSGNGFAFLTLFTRTGDALWLDRARAFAMHAVEQVTRLRESTGRGRYSLFTGDIGAALLAASCLSLDSRFPGIDDL